MRYFTVFSFLYLVVASLIVATVRENGFEFVSGNLAKNVDRLSTILMWVGFFVVGLILNAILVGKNEMKSRIKPIVLAFFGVIFFQTAFTLTKTTLPYLVPFYADPYLAKFDQFLHGGFNPVFLVHAIDPYISIKPLYYLYTMVWLVLAIYFPLILAAFDGNSQRRVRFLVLYFFGWIFIGNIAALAVSSAGPVFFDRVYGGSQYAELDALLDKSGINSSFIGFIQAYLWELYSNYGQAAGSGISAFPSVHVSMATVLGLYAYERSRLLGLLGFIFVVIILFLSVYTGYHYAIDGYFSIIAVLLAWVLLRRYKARAST